MSPFPTDPDARKRLHDAQRAEADALKAVELAARARDRVQAKLDTANAEVDRAKSTLVAVSGPWRAALLLNEDVRAPASPAFRAHRRDGISDTAPAGRGLIRRRARRRATTWRT